MQFAKNAKYGPLNNGSLVLFKDPYKMIYYYGYDELDDFNGELVELYDIYEDPEELVNLYDPAENLSRVLLDEMKTKLVGINRGYR